MVKLQLTGQNLGQVFNFRSGHLQAAHFFAFSSKNASLKAGNSPAVSHELFKPLL